MEQSRLILPDEFLRRRDPEPLHDLKHYVHKRIQIALGLGRTPWKIPVAYDPNCGLPCNVETGRRYRGINTLLLGDTHQTFGFRSKWWGTEEEWTSVGAAIGRDEVPTIIVEGNFRQLDERRVYNAQQVFGAEKWQPIINEIVRHEDADFGPMGRFMEIHHPDVRYDVGDKENPPDWIGYIPPYPWSKFPHHDSGDYILMQSVERCANKATHYSILLHEFVHWGEVRTDWMHSMPIREFVAEMGMHVLGLELGIPHALDDHNRFLWQKDWNSTANSDETFFFRATAQVDRVCDFLLGPILGRREIDVH